MNVSAGPCDAFLPARIDLKAVESGPLSEMTFAAKDLYDVRRTRQGRFASWPGTDLPVCMHTVNTPGLWNWLKVLTDAQVEGHVTGCGSPEWAATHAPAKSTAPAVQARSATCLGSACVPLAGLGGACQGCWAPSYAKADVQLILSRKRAACGSSLKVKPEQMPEQALLDVGARLVGKTQMDELVRSFPNCFSFVPMPCWRWLRPYMHISSTQLAQALPAGLAPGQAQIIDGGCYAVLETHVPLTTLGMLLKSVKLENSEFQTIT